MSQKLESKTPLWRLAEWFPRLSSEQLIFLKAYHDDLCKWTKKINLISNATIYESDRIHFADCIMGCEIFSNKVESKFFKDLGSGNGFPGIVFAILNQSIEVECVDSDERKIVFIKQFALRQGLKNLKAKCVRIEDMSLGVFLGSARGLGSVKKILELLDVNSVKGSSLYLFKGPEWVSEKKELTNRECSMWNIELLGEYSLPKMNEIAESRVILRATRG